MRQKQQIQRAINADGTNVISNFACTTFGNVACTEIGNMVCT